MTYLGVHILRWSERPHQSTQIEHPLTINPGHRDIDCITVHGDNMRSASLEKLRHLSEDIFLEYNFAKNSKKHILNLSKIIDMKKAGGRFSTLPVSIVDDD